jgi:putative FmdB family regulatory protein
MPTYDYVCDSCAHQFEAFESIKAEPQTVCPECREAQLRRKIGPGAAILFKGSGFYQTDYRSESYKKGAQADAPGEAPAEKASAAAPSAPAAASRAESRPSTDGVS